MLPRDNIVSITAMCFFFTVMFMYYLIRHNMKKFMQRHTGPGNVVKHCFNIKQWKGAS